MMAEHTCWLSLRPDKLSFVRVPKPVPEPGEALLQVLAAGVNNTEINTRLGWYSSSVTKGTDAMSDVQQCKVQQKSDGGWNEATPFPFIQGTDCCGRVIAVGDDVDPALIGKRALVRSCMRPQGFNAPENVWMDSDFDGAFAQFVVVPASEVFPVSCDWTDAGLATVPCAYGTAETMLHRTGLTVGERVLVTSASGRVGSATVQLAQRRKADVIPIAGRTKPDQLRALGVAAVLDRNDDLIEALGENAVNVVVDIVAGPGFPTLLKLLRRRGRYASSAIVSLHAVCRQIHDGVRVGGKSSPSIHKT